MKRDESVALDMLRAARTAQSFVTGMDRARFDGDEKTQSAVLHQLLVLGEAAKRVSDSFRAQHPSVPWRLLAGMRDKLIHAYDAVDLDEVWNTLTTDLPDLTAVLSKLVPRAPR